MSKNIRNQKDTPNATLDDSSFTGSPFLLRTGVDAAIKNAKSKIINNTGNHATPW